MTYDCANRPRTAEHWRAWKEQGRCQHDSSADSRCAGCAHRREESTQVPQDGTGGVR